MDIVKHLSNELSLRVPQRLSLVNLDSQLSRVDLFKDSSQEIEAKIGAIKFDTKFPSLCYALATGVGKTKLMGAMMLYLYQKKGLRNFFILTPGETIYTKTKANFTRGNEKYVLEGASDVPEFNLINGENYEYSNFANRLFDDAKVNIFIFNIQKIFNERTDVQFKFHKYKETLEDSFAGILQKKKDLVVFMDESHRYRGEKSLKAIEYLNPVLGLEFTATPGSQPNVVYRFSLGEAIGKYVKTPVVITRKDDDSYKGDLEDIKLLDGIKRHRRKKVLLEEYCKTNNLPLVLPLTLITTKDIEHSKVVKAKITSDSFFNGEYKNKTLLVHSKSEESELAQLLGLENEYNRNEIVIHVNKLKEGWDVKNIYTIIPIRASVSEILTEQTIGRGLRLPFGELTGNEELDTLEIISHDQYQRVIEAAKKWIKEIQIRTYDQEPDEELEPITIEPLSGSKYEIDIPQVQVNVQTTAELKPFKPKIGIESFEELKTQIIGTEIAEGHTKVLEDVEHKLDLPPVAYLSRLIIKESDELDISDKEIVMAIAKDYLQAIDKDESIQAKALAMHTQKILSDVLSQIRGKFDSSTKIDFTTSTDKISFTSFTKAVVKGFKVKDRKAVSDDDCVDILIAGYTKTVFPQNTFDSKQEKWFADVLEADNEVIRWVRPPMNQFPVYYKGGRYNPDFIAETKDGYFVIEIKEADKIENKDKEVYEKAEQAIKWCETVTKGTKKEWKYKLIPHTAVNRTDSFKAIISRAVVVER